jgi:hypothetical protein
MGLFTKYNPRDRIYICPIQYEHEQLREGQVRVLFCDSKGNLTTDIVEASTSELVQDAVAQMGKAGKAGAVLSMELAGGQSATFAVEIDAEQAEALAQITQFAFKTGTTGTIPDYLRKCPSQIIKLGESRRKELKKGIEKSFSDAEREIVLLPNPLASKPIRYAEPNAAIILKRLPPNEQTRPGMQRVLILDYRGIFCIVRVPVEALSDAERELEQYKKTHNPLGVIVFSTNEEGFLMGPMGITEAEKEALDMVEQYFEATGCSMGAIPTDVSTILARAKVLMPARNSENANP